MNNRKITALFFNLVFALALAITTLPAQAAVPGTLNYQGQLTNAAGVPVNGAVNMTFKLYDVSTGGAALWSETQSVTVSNGLYSVMLGQATPLTSSLLDAPRYLGIKVASDAEMAPRIALGSAPFALLADDAATVGGFTPAQLQGATGPQGPAGPAGPTGATGLIGPTGSPGSPGAMGPQGATGATGANGETVLNGAGAPGAGAGVNGDFYIDTAANAIYGPKTGGAWGSATSLVGPAGATGPQGPAGPAGPTGATGLIGPTGSPGSPGAMGPQGATGATGANGETVLNGAGAPGAGAGVNGDFYIDTAANAIYGPKTGGAWGSATSLVGPAGATGPQGPVINVQAPQANTLTAVDTVGSVGYWTSISIGADGLPVISYWDGSNTDLKVAKCGNAACSAGNTLTAVDTVDWVGGYPSIAIGADGLPVISYRDGTNGDLKVAHCGNAACSAGNTLTAVDTAGDVGFYTSISIGSDGLPVISYYDNTNSDLKVAHCGNAACSAGNTLTTVDTVGGNVGQYTSLSIGADGLPVISYTDVNNGDLKVAHCGNAACSAGNTLTAVDTVGVVGYYTSLSIGADGLPVISYTDSTNFDLKVAHCGDAACSVGNTLTTVDTLGDVGYYTSISIGPDGLPVISYQDVTNGDLKVAKCGNAACSAGNTLTTVDTVGGNVGQYTSLSIGADGLPVISYYDLFNGDLKVAKCANAFCAPYFRRR